MDNINMAGDNTAGAQGGKEQEETWNGFKLDELMEATKQLQANKKANALKRHRSPSPSSHEKPAAPGETNDQPKTDHRKKRKKGKGKQHTATALTSTPAPSPALAPAASHRHDNAHRVSKPAERLQKTPKGDWYRPGTPSAPARKRPSREGAAKPESILETVNSKMNGFANPDEPILDIQDAESLALLFSDAHVVNNCGRQLKKRLCNILDRCSEVLTNPKHQKEIRYEKGAENDEEFWTRAAQAITDLLKPENSDAKLEGKVAFKLMSGFTRLRKEDLAAQNRVGGPSGTAAGQVPGLAASDDQDDDDQVQDSDAGKIERRLQKAFDKWILFLDTQNDAALDPSIFANLKM